MKRNGITISENGTVTIVDPVEMTLSEIADLFGVSVPAIRSGVKSILGSGILAADVTGGGVLEGNILLPDYYGLDMITALSFRLGSRRAGIFREWILEKIAGQKKPDNFQVFIAVNGKERANNHFLN